MSSLYIRENNAVYNNPPTANGRTADIHITEHGSNIYYAWCAWFGFMGFVFLGWSRAKRRTDRVFFYLTIAIHVAACLSYYAMGSNLGMTPITVEFQRDSSRVRGNVREIFWVRYVEWFITTPLIIAKLFLSAGVPVPKMLMTIFMDEVMIIMGLVGAVTNTGYKWGFFGFGCAAMFYVFSAMVFQGRKYARHMGSDVHRAYLIGLFFVAISWVGYPIAWGVAEGGNIIAPDSEAIYYAILDMTSKTFFAVAFLLLHSKVDPARMGLKMRDYDEDFFLHYAPHHKRTHSQEAKEEGSIGEGLQSTTAPRNSAAGPHTETHNNGTTHGNEVNNHQTS